MIAQWLGPRGTNIDIDHYDFRSGGTYLYNHTGPDGVTYAFSGIFHTVRENEFAIQTFEFSGYPDIVSIEFMSFEDLGGGRCRLRAHCVYPAWKPATAWPNQAWKAACPTATSGSRSCSRNRGPAPQLNARRRPVTFTFEGHLLPRRPVTPPAH